MNLIEAIEQLQELLDEEGNIEILVSSDEEGNDYRGLSWIQADWCHVEGWEVYPVNDDDVGVYYELSELERKVILA